MGCDVHVHSEILVKGKWEHYAQIKMLRCYAIFEKMAGVRGCVENSIAHGRGLPLNCSVTSELESTLCQGHSHSWLSSIEIYELIRFIGEEGIIKPGEQPEYACGWGYFFGHRWSYFGHKDRFDLEESPFPKIVDDFRFVFWFDS